MRIICRSPTCARCSSPAVRPLIKRYKGWRELILQAAFNDAAKIPTATHELTQRFLLPRRWCPRDSFPCACHPEVMQ
jgi:hypothetical protein